MSDLIYGGTFWKSNAEMIVDMFRIGYIKPTDVTLDPTFENGVWWRKMRPDRLITYYREVDGSDFRELPDETNDFYDVITFDPPYVCPGGIRTSTIPDFQTRYKMNEGGADDRLFKTPEELQDMNNAGLSRMAELVKPGGKIMVKSMNYVSGGHVWWGTDLIEAHGISIGLKKVDEFHHLKKTGGAQEKDRKRKDGTPTTQQHARRNYTTLTIFQRPKSSSSSTSAQSSQSEDSTLL